ncbi:MAG: LCP family protein [Anaerolineae bacterium]|nr:LCP family protein [Anaerolineae bacterium]
MTVRKTSRISRFFGFILFRLVPFVLIIGIIWSSYGAAQAIARRIGEQVEAGERLASYESTLSAILPTLTTHTAEPTTTFTATATPTITFTPTPSFTNTPTSTATAPNTPTLIPSATLTATPSPQPTTVAQVFATNTARPIAVTLPAMNTAVPTNTPTTESSPTATFTAEPTATLQPAFTATPRPLPTVFLPENADPGIVAATAIPTVVPLIDRQGYDLVNILLLGVDDEITGDNVQRTDTMIVVSINRTTNTVSMLSIPRDLYVFIPGWTMQRMNLAYFRGESGGWTDGGFGLMRQTILYNFGINVHYYALINLSGFKQIIDTLGGVDVSVDCAIQDYELVGAPPPPEAIKNEEDALYTLPVGFYHFDGGSALWYARSRHTSIEFDRGRRQQQILRAMWRSARSQGIITQLPELWSQLTQVLETDLSFEDMLGLLPYGLSLEPDRIESFTFSRLYHTTPWTPPDGANVQLPNYEAVRELMTDFYQPPTESQVLVQNASIEVYNGTNNANWDRVAADSLAYNGGFTAVASGTADNNNYLDTILIDYTGQTKGSSTAEIAEILSVKPENVRVEPDPNRTTDFKVILGSNYTSCTSNAILEVENTTGE